jgi:hypothetical protein
MSEVVHQSALRRAVIASTVGTTIEWYDFLIYSTVTGWSSGLHTITTHAARNSAAVVGDLETGTDDTLAAPTSLPGSRSIIGSATGATIAPWIVP